MEKVPVFPPEILERIFGHLFAQLPIDLFCFREFGKDYRIKLPMFNFDEENLLTTNQNRILDFIWNSLSKPKHNLILIEAIRRDGSTTCLLFFALGIIKNTNESVLFVKERILERFKSHFLFSTLVKSRRFSFCKIDDLPKAPPRIVIFDVDEPVMPYKFVPFFSQKDIFVVFCYGRHQRVGGKLVEIFEPPKWEKFCDATLKNE